MSQETTVDNKRIAKNTIALYLRTLLTMVIGLYTGRVMLQALGVENYGINAVVGGIVAMSGLLTGTMSQAISRYITCAIGKGDRERLKMMFSTSVNAQIVMALIAALVLEIAGVWFLNNGANIPEGRLTAANWVLQCSVVGLMLSLISSPLNALIIAHERLTVYAYMSILDVTIKLSVVFIITAFDGDRLILLAVINLFFSFIIQGIYLRYCRRHFEETVYSPKMFERGLLKELTVFSGWNLMNNGAYIFSTQGVNMLVNVFFGVVFNASRSIATTVNGAVQGFVGNFSVAFSPQITKQYAAGNVDVAIRLANRGTKFIWLMMYVFIVPVCMEAEMLLKLWLGEVPEMAALFLRFAMFESLAVTSGQNLFRLIQADGRVKNYTIHAAITAGLIFPLVWIGYQLGMPVWTAYLIFILDFLFLNLVRFYDLKRLMPYSVRQHLRECLFPCLTVSVVSFTLPCLLAYYTEDGIGRFFWMVAVSVVWTTACCVVFGLTANERAFFYEKIGNAVRKAFPKR